jgi:TPR repeat protein
MKLFAADITSESMLYNLSLCLATGQGCTRDIPAAAQHMLDCAESGRQEAYEVFRKMRRIAK